MSNAYSQYKMDVCELNELKWFCFQYEKKKKIIRNTENKTEKIALTRDIEAIDSTFDLLAEDEMIIELLKKSVTNKNMPYEALGGVPMGRRQFYELRRRFFFLLQRIRRLAVVWEKLNDDN
ncbi:MAG: hypothetical protein IJZ64_00080 [Ruminococcus sp.]|nr:hypothetical protein [Ruminococcus sp.]